MTAPPSSTVAQEAVAALWHPQNVTNPYLAYEHIRALGPCVMVELDGWPAVFLTGHPAVSAVLRFPGAVSGNGMDGAAASSDGLQLLQHMMLFHNGASHARLRGLVAAAFTPRVVEEQRELVRALIQELLSGLHAQGPGADLVEGLANPLPARVIMGMLGLSGEDETRFVRWSQSVADLLGSANQTPELMASIDADAREMRGYFRDLVGELRARPQPGLLSAMAAVEDGGERLSGDELLSNAVLLLTAGHETTSNLIPGGLLELSRQPGAWTALTEQPRHPNVADELLRVVSPVQFDGRMLSAPLTVSGQTLPAGTAAQLLLGAANRDPDVFPEPDRIDWNRPNSARHLAFAAGAHYCLGASLARLEIAEVFAALAGQFPHLQVEAEPPFKPNLLLRGPARLRVRLDG
ncbi:cytochrome P450 [Deinococcus oregonensis]|uniref:Cytochrome P450 n=1 Tax=Deinococcus oregonensis TaxID=1805970 RepID=A0ABV6AYR3_9DEIO